jgi:uncharacterized DUF497 family protein
MWYNCHTSSAMRFRFSRAKSEALKRNPKRGIGFEDAQEIFARPYYLDRRWDDPQQYRAIGWVGDRLFTLIFEIREDRLGEYYHLVTLWRSTREERGLYGKNS